VNPRLRSVAIFLLPWTLPLLVAARADAVPCMGFLPCVSADMLELDYDATTGMLTIADKPGTSAFTYFHLTPENVLTSSGIAGGSFLLSLHVSGVSYFDGTFTSGTATTTGSVTIGGTVLGLGPDLLTGTIDSFVFDFNGGFGFLFDLDITASASGLGFGPFASVLASGPGDPATPAFSAGFRADTNFNADTFDVPVPEPSTLLLVAVGGGGGLLLKLYRRRRVR
jgi:hypothetical protein